MDGTILDTLDDLKDSLNYALRLSGFPERTEDEVRRFVGNGIKKLIERGVPGDTPAEMTDKVHSDFTHYYKKHCRDKTKPYDGICKLISSLKEKGMMCAVVSNKDDYAVSLLCDEYFKGLFDYSVGSREGVRKKPYPDSVYAVLDALSVKKEDAVYIGDSEVDIQTAKNASLPYVTVLWGFRDRDFLLLNGAKVTAETPDELFSRIV